MESPHNYENSRHETTIFVCPGATSFDVEFDERCETEKRCERLMLQLNCCFLVITGIISCYRPLVALKYALYLN